MRILDLFAGAGGATRGYQLAFPAAHIVGVDINPQPRYVGDGFHQADALTFPLEGFDLIHASPPCQGYSAMSKCRPGLAEKYPRLIGPVRERLIASGIPYVIENVVGAPLLEAKTLCGATFGLELYRHRLFETSFYCSHLWHEDHRLPASRAGHWKPGTVMSVAGHVSPMWKAREVMGIDWMTRDELAESIPPAYTQYIGEQFAASLQQVA